MKRLLEKYLAACVRPAVIREKIRVVVIAGSVGKTSTKEAIGVALGGHLHGSDILIAPKNYNNEFGVPLSLLRRSAPGRSPWKWFILLLRATLMYLGLVKIGCRTAVLEYAPDHPGDLAWLIGIAHPDVAILTAIAPEHTEFFGSLEGVAEEELTIIRCLRQDDVAILNIDDPRIVSSRGETKGAVVSYGESLDATVRLIKADFIFDEALPMSSGIDTEMVVAGDLVRLRLIGVFGHPQALAAAAALSVVYALDYSMAEAVEHLMAHRGVPGRTRIIEGIKHTLLLDDTYNASPEAVVSALRDLKRVPVREGCHRIAALGDMLELGSLAHESHQQMGRAVVEHGVDMLVVCGTFAPVVAQAAREAGMKEDLIFTFPDSEQAGRFLQDRMKQGDVILIKGSQGVRMEKIVKELMAHPEQAEQLLVRQSGGWEEK